ncbi:MAG: MMPL family transporter [Desulfatitalea sp.]|nr:MMPL family transporter [Desulfatitalea sp.]NNK01756.1 MMPL family transporter [Desulfatitalea sp.]
MNQNKNDLGTSATGFGRLALWIFDHRWLSLLLFSACFGMGLYFAGKVSIDASFEAWFDEKDRTYDYYLEYKNDFGSDEIAYLLYKAPDMPHGPFNLEVMRKIANLTRVLEDEVPFVKEVTSLANAEFIEAKADSIEVHELLLDFPKTQDELLRIRDIVMNKPIYVGGLIDKDATHGAIILEMSLSGSDPIEKFRLDPEGGDGMDNLYPQVTNSKIDEILARPEYEDIRFYRIGDIPNNSYYNRLIKKEISIFPLVTFAIVGIMTMLLFRTRFLGFVGPLTVVLSTLILTLGFMGLMGYRIATLFMIVPPFLTTIGVAQSVHLLSEFQICRSKGMPIREALRQTLELVGKPCLLAALTTAAGLSSMVVSPLLNFSEFAVFGAAGVMIAFVLTTTLLVFFLSFARDKHAAATPEFQSGGSFLSPLLVRIVNFDLKHRGAIAFIAAAIFMIAFIGVFKLKVDFNFLENFKENVGLRQDVVYVEQVMGGSMNAVYVFDTGTADGIKNSDVLKQLEGLQAWAEKNPLVQKTYSIVDVLKDINQSFHGDDPEYFKLPESRELIAQYLLMYEISGGKELEDYVNSDYSRTALELRVKTTYASRVDEMLRQFDTYMAEHPITTADVKLTGIGLLWVKIADYIADSQIRGYTLAFVMIAILMCLAFRSIKVGMLSMIPNLAPVIITLGFMGWWGMHLDYLRLMLAVIAIGIAVDDTIHIVSRIRSEFFRCGNYAEAIRIGLSHVGQAIVITSAVLICGFLVFLLSELAILASFGILLAITITTALIADLFLMPVLILRFQPFGKEFTPQHSASAKAA